jgi:hypothetical protein
MFGALLTFAACGGGDGGCLLSRCRCHCFCSRACALSRVGDEFGQQRVGPTKVTNPNFKFPLLLFHGWLGTMNRKATCADAKEQQRELLTREDSDE